MKIYVDKIPSGGMEFSETCQSADWDLERADIKFDKLISFAGKATKQPGSVFIDVRVKANLRMNCSLCLEEFKLPLDKKINIVYKLEGQKVLDISPDIREEIILDYPLKPLCSANCKGLCPVCGANLNKAKCKHAKNRKDK